jgi:Beta-propeller repeat
MRSPIPALLRTISLAATAILSFSFAVAAPPVSAGSSVHSPAFDRALPLTFEENRGQAAEDVRFLAHTPAGELRFTADQVLLPCYSADGPVALSVLQNGSVHLEAEQPTGGVANYYTGKDRKHWIERVPLNRQIRYAQVAPGVDLVFHGETGNLEYDLEVAPGGNPAAVALQVSHGGSFHLETDGSATVQVTGGSSGCQSLHLLTPSAFQTADGRTTKVGSHFTLDEAGRLAFEVADYNRNLPLTIDPVVSYTKIIGVNNSTTVSALQIDSAGDVFIIGETSATNYPVAGSGVGSIGSSGSQQVYVTKLDPTGTQILYSTYIPAPGFNRASAIALDAFGNAYVAGIAGSSGFPTTSSNLGTCTTFCNAGFVAKFNTTGGLIYSTLIGSGQQLPKGITVDNAGNAYLAGLSADAGLQTVNAFQSGYSGGVCTSCSGAFFAKLNPTGTAWVFSSYFYSPGQINSETFATSIARDAAGNIYFAGDGDSVPLKGSFQYATGGSFAAEFASDGKTLIFSTLLGGNTIVPDSVSGLQVGPDGTIYVAGSQIAQDFPYTVSAYRHPTYPIGYAQSKQYIFAAAINPARTGYTWSTFLGQGFVSSTAVDPIGNFYVAGTFSLGSVLLKNALAADAASGAYILELDPTGALVMATDFGGRNLSQVPFGMAVDSAGNVYVAGTPSGTGTSNGISDPINVGTGTAYTDQSKLGSYNTFVAKISPANQPQISLSYLGAALALRNAGSADLHIGSIQPGSTITSVGNTCGSTLAAGTSCFLTPLSTTPNGTLTINSDAQPASQTFTPTGLSSSAGAIVLVDGSRLNFPPQQNGTTSAPLPLTISNVGSANATLTSILTFGYFTQSNNCPGSLPPQSSCTAMVTVSPTANGTPSADIGVVYGNGIRTDVYAYFTPNPTDGPLLLSSDGYGLAYGNVLLGTTSLLRTVTVTNTGTSPVTVDPPTLSGTGATSFAISANTCSGIQLQPEASCVIGLVFQPTAVGRLAVPLLITGGSSSLTIYLVGTGITSPTLSVTSTSTDLGNVVLGASATQVFQVLNNSGAALTLTSIVAGLADGSAQTDFSQQNNCPLTLASQATCTITVTFAPSDTGLRKGAVSLIVNGGVLNQTVSITGTGLPVLAATPSTLTFATPVGSSSLQSVTLMNQSTSAQSFNLAVTGPFAINSTTCVSPLAAGAQCVVSVSFQPISPGLQTSALTAALTGIPPEAINLTGTGTSPNAILSPNALVFGRTVEGVASAAQTITLTNSGTAPLNSLALTLSGANAADFSFTTTCGSAVPAGQTCSIAVVFKPSLLTSEGATFNLASNASGSPASVPLSGTGAAPDFYATAASTATSVTAGAPATYNLTIQADPGLTGTATFACSGLPAYATCTFAPASVPLTGNATSVLTVTTSQTQTAAVTPTIARFEAVSVAALLLLPFVRRRPRRTLFGFLLVSALTGLSGCSSAPSAGTSTPAPVTNLTPKGTYTLTVTESSATVSHTLPLTLTVQ